MRAAIYCRISRDPEGERAGVDRQEEDCRNLAEREGFEVIGQPYIDNDISASTRSRKIRPRYDAMLEAVRNGEVSVIVAYSYSRLTRRPAEWIELINLANAGKLRIKTVVSGEHDLSTADGRAVALTVAAWDAAEAERAGERIARAHLQRARQGTTNHGSRPFGWQDDKATLHPVEAPLIRKAVADVVDGVGLNEICREWNDAGVRTIRGNEWDHRGLRQMLKGPRLAGWRVHQGKIATGVDGQPVKGAWEPLLTQDEFDRLQVALTGRSGRSGGRRGARRYLLAGVVRCGTCGSRMYGSVTPTGHAYVCRGGQGATSQHTVSIAGIPTDKIVSDVVLARLRQAGDLTPPAVEFAGADRLQGIPIKIAELMEAYTRGQLSGAVVFPQIEALEVEQSALRAERQKFIVATAAPTNVTVEAFMSPDVARRRAIIEQVIEAIVVAPTTKGAPWSPDRLTYVWRVE